MKLIGIDPGLNGAIALIGKESANVWDMPTMPKVAGNGNQVDPYELADIIVSCIQVGATGVIIEKVHAMPQQGGVSNFSFGKSLGIVEGVVGAMEVLLEADHKHLIVRHVTPQEWKKAAGLIKKDKDASRLKALEIWPRLKRELSRKKDEGRAEALLIAKYGRVALARKKPLDK